MTASRIDILCCPLSEVDDALLAQYENLLSEEELARLRSFRALNAAKEFVVGRALLRTALAERLQCDARALRFTKNEEGKPSLSFPGANWHFNLTHSHDWVALALCEGASVGIDIESYKRRNNLPGIAKRFFSDAENVQLDSCKPDKWLDYFFAVWTLKEAHAKALGCGLPKILPCSSIGVNLTAGTIDFTLSDAAVTPHHIASWLYKIDQQSALALVAHGIKFSEPKIYFNVPQQKIDCLEIVSSASGFLSHHQ